MKCDYTKKNYWIDVDRYFTSKKNNTYNKTYYKIMLGNNTESKVNAYVYVFGKLIGLWTIESNSLITFDKKYKSNKELDFSNNNIIEKDSDTFIKVIFKTYDYSNTIYLLSKEY